MEENKERSKKGYWLFVFLTVILAVTTVILGVKLSKMKETLVFEISTNDTLLAQKQKMMIQLENLHIEYDQLSKEYENLGDLFDKEKAKVESLMKQIKNEKGSVAAYKKQVDILKEQLRDYLSQIETLRARNKELNEENMKVRSDLDSAMRANTELSSAKKELSEKVETGSKLVAYEIISDGIRLKSSGSEIPVKKASKVKKIRTCFLLGENPLTPKGTKTVYLRIAEPGGQILVKGKDESNMFTFKGEKIAFSVKGNIDYQGKAQDLCFYWENTGTLKAGKYFVDIFVDDQQIGSTTFTLE